MSDGRRRIQFAAMRGQRLEDIAKTITATPDALPTPFPTWNLACGEEGGKIGLAKKWFIVLGGNDGSGKSYLLLNLAACGVRAGKKVGFVNFEMTELGMTCRFLSIVSGIPKYHLEHGKYFSMDKWLSAKGEVDKLYREGGGMLITNRTAVFDLDDVSKSYHELRESGCEVIIIDYAQLIHVHGADGIFGRTEAVANKLRELTHEYDVTTIVASQFSRAGKGRKRPSRHGLQGGSAWENNANQIMLIHHGESEIVDDVKYTKIICDKNRHGMSGFDVDIAWDLKNMQWVEDTDEAIHTTGW